MKRVVIKIGTAVLTKENGKIDTRVIAGLVDQISGLLNGGKEVLIVSSGAIGIGMGLLNVKKRPKNLAELQAMASIGQTGLMDTYNKFFREAGSGYLTGQILLTQDDFDDRLRHLNIRYTMNALLKHKIVPIINENDTISTEEIKCGDNDRISALVADLVKADGLIILTNVDGLLDKSGSLVEEVEHINKDIKDLVQKKCTGLGTGGMHTKIIAAEIAVKSGIDCYMANGKASHILTDIFSRKGRFTHFKSGHSEATDRKRWIGFSRKAKGVIIVDNGAGTAVTQKNKSLLSAGILEIKGLFKAGDTVSITDTQNRELARGITNYASAEISKIKGAQTKQIASILGYKDHDEVIHKDNLVVL